MQKLSSIQALRGIAATLVFLCHLFSIEQQNANRMIQLTDFWDAGIHGVDLFFVISGFVIVWVASDRPPGWRNAADFMYARFTRVYPVWWLFALSAAIGLWVLEGVPWDVDRIAPAGLTGPSHLAKSFLLWPQAVHPVLGVGWTLVHEVYFYAGFALLILVLPARWRLAGLAVWAALILIGARAGLSSQFGNNWMDVIFFPMTLQFLLGAGVAYLIKAGQRRFAATCIMIGTIGWCAAFLSLDQFLPWFGTTLSPDVQPIWRRTLLFGPTSAMLIYGLVALETQGKLRRNIPTGLVAIGDWSYSLYLCHVLVISFFGRMTYAVLDPDTAVGIAAYFLITSTATIITAAAAYHMVERPLITGLRRDFKMSVRPRGSTLSVRR